MTSAAMPLTALAEVDSTSSYAARLLQEGKAAPFAVVAERQTSGRGRRGHGWESPAGNLYITLALPPPPAFVASGANLAELGALPLVAATIAARALQQAFGLRVTLKWPNDILFAGRKLAGLLLETSSSGEGVGAILVGLGLNVETAPPLVGTYSAVSLSEILGKPLRAANLAELIVSAFASEWPAATADLLPSAFEDYATGSGQLWSELNTASRSSQPAWWRARSVATDGSLTLEAVSADKAPLKLTSADHGLVWRFQGEQVRSLYVADVGNTAIKLAYFASARDAAPASIEAVSVQASAAELTQALKRLLVGNGGQITDLTYLSVNPAAALRLQEAAAALGVLAAPLAKRPVRRWGEGYRLSELGPDRLAAIEGRLALLRAEERGLCSRASVIVSCGTATTIDVVRWDGEHLGGLILPGLMTSLRSLHDATGLLPLVNLEDLEGLEADLTGRERLGRGTMTALARGALLMTASAVDAVARDALGVDAAASGAEISSVEVVLTGGFSDKLAPFLEHPLIRPERFLVLTGLRSMLLGGLLA